MYQPIGCYWLSKQEISYIIKIWCRLLHTLIAFRES